jgi:hypothetical protein
MEVESEDGVSPECQESLPVEEERVDVDSGDGEKGGGLLEKDGSKAGEVVTTTEIESKSGEDLEEPSLTGETVVEGSVEEKKVEEVVPVVATKVLKVKRKPFIVKLPLPEPGKGILVAAGFR